MCESKARSFIAWPFNFCHVKIVFRESIHFHIWKMEDICPSYFLWQGNLLRCKIVSMRMGHTIFSSVLEERLPFNSKKVFFPVLWALSSGKHRLLPTLGWPYIAFFLGSYEGNRWCPCSAHTPSDFFSWKCVFCPNSGHFCLFVGRLLTDSCDPLWQHTENWKYLGSYLYSSRAALTDWWVQWF